jgi:hypothetical protein
MPTALTATTVSRNVTDGLDLAGMTLDAADATDNTFQNDGTTLLRVKNSNAATRTLTVAFANPTPDGVAISPQGKQYVIPATTGDRLIGPFPVATYGTTVTLKWSAVTNVTVKPLQPTN